MPMRPSFTGTRPVDSGPARAFSRAARDGLAQGALDALQLRQKFLVRLAEQLHGETECLAEARYLDGTAGYLRSDGGHLLAFSVDLLRESGAGALQQGGRRSDQRIDGPALLGGRQIQRIEQCSQRLHDAAALLQDRVVAGHAL